VPRFLKCHSKRASFFAAVKESTKFGFCRTGNSLACNGAKSVVAGFTQEFLHVTRH
jgi:hypothetical protein